VDGFAVWQLGGVVERDYSDGNVQYYRLFTVHDLFQVARQQAITVSTGDTADC